MVVALTDGVQLATVQLVVQFTSFGVSQVTITHLDRDALWEERDDSIVSHTGSSTGVKVIEVVVPDDGVVAVTVWIGEPASPAMVKRAPLGTSVVTLVFRASVSTVKLVAPVEMEP